MISQLEIIPFFFSAKRHKMDCVQYFESKSLSDSKLDNIETELANEEKLDENKISENWNDCYNSQSALGVNLINEKQEITDKIEQDYQKDNEISILYLCSMCPTIFEKKSSLFGHFTAIHEETKKLDCDICNSHFRSESKLKRHVKSFHEKLKPFACKLCESTFSQKYAFN